jgi:hypothetical protein
MMTFNSPNHIVAPTETLPLHHYHHPSFSLDAFWENGNDVINDEDDDQVSIVSFEIDDIAYEEEMELEFEISSTILEDSFSEAPNTTVMLIRQDNLRNFSDDGLSVCSDITAATNEDTRLNHQPRRQPPPPPPSHINIGGGVDINTYEKERIVIADHSSSNGNLSIDEMSLVDMPQQQQQHWDCLNNNDDDHMAFEGRQFFIVGGCDSQQQQQQQSPSSQQYALPMVGDMEPQHFPQSHHHHNMTQTTTTTTTTTTKIVRPIEQRPSTAWTCVQELLDTIVSDESDGEGDNNDDASWDDILD